jgi:hypothetical protein
VLDGHDARRRAGQEPRHNRRAAPRRTVGEHNVRPPPAQPPSQPGDGGRMAAHSTEVKHRHTDVSVEDRCRLLPGSAGDPRLHSGPPQMLGNRVDDASDPPWSKCVCIQSDPDRRVLNRRAHSEPMSKAVRIQHASSHEDDQNSSTIQGPHLVRHADERVVFRQRRIQEDGRRPSPSRHPLDALP